MGYLTPLHGLDRPKARSLGELTAEIRSINIEKGWRNADGSPTKTWGESVALLHSEVSETLEAYRDHGLADATEPVGRCAFGTCDVHGLPKPEGVGSELADVLIRLLDMCDAFGMKAFDMDREVDDVDDVESRRRVETFGDHLAWLHSVVSELWNREGWHTRAAFAPAVLYVLVTMARKFDINLNAEVERKIAYNRTREFRHGGRAL